MTKTRCKRSPTYYPSIGVVSEGTMRTEDLLDTFAHKLAYHMQRMRLGRDQRKRYNTLLRDVYVTQGVIACLSDDASIDLTDGSQLVGCLFDALDEIAPPYAYFGATEGDGACYGFWPAIDMHSCDEPIRTQDIERDHWGEDILLVNDHGNVECGHVTRRGKFKPYWFCV